jgi:hypothetical protein
MLFWYLFVVESLERCCVLVGQMKIALLEIRGKQCIRRAAITCLTTKPPVEKYHPDRIIIECSYVDLLTAYLMPPI